jgi:hypothetical protein
LKNLIAARTLRDGLQRWKGNAVRFRFFVGDFVLHSLRHTMLTRLGESGVDAFSIKADRRAQQYRRIAAIHPSHADAVERACKRLPLHGTGLEIEANDCHPLQYPLH